MEGIDTGKVRYSGHATKRMQQRGIEKLAVGVILRFANKKAHVGNGLVSLYVSKQRLESLKDKGEIAAKLAEKVAGICIVVAHHPGNPTNQTEIVTVLNAQSKGGRRYRRN